MDEVRIFTSLPLPKRPTSKDCTGTNILEGDTLYLNHSILFVSVPRKLRAKLFYLHQVCKHEHVHSRAEWVEFSSSTLLDIIKFVGGSCSDFYFQQVIQSSHFSP